MLPELFKKLKKTLNIIKNTLIISLSGLYIWEQHEVPEKKKKSKNRNFIYQHNKKVPIK